MSVSRRIVLTTSAAAAVFAARPAMAQEACAVFTADRQAAITPEAALQRLKDGNDRFVSGQTINCDLRVQVKATAKGQAPFAAIVGCIDSRVPPELVFDQRLGDVFAARIAGNFVNTDIIASLEFATKVAGAKAIVVLGHTECGAIKGALDNVKLGNLTEMLKSFEPAIQAAGEVPGGRSSKNHALLDKVTDVHATLTAKAITSRSEVLRELVAAKQLVVAAAVHDLATGRVSFQA